MSAEIFFLSDLFDENSISSLKEPLHKKLTLLVSQYRIQHTRGDIIALRRGAYRNQGKFVWDGKKVKRLSYLHDENGHIPPYFSCPDEFSPLHWKDVITSSLVPVLLTRKRRTMLLRNLGEMQYSEGGYFAVTAFVANNECYRILFRTTLASSESIIQFLSAREKYIYLSYEDEDGTIERNMLYKSLRFG